MMPRAAVAEAAPWNRLRSERRSVLFHKRQRTAAPKPRNSNELSFCGIEFFGVPGGSHVRYDRGPQIGQAGTNHHISLGSNQRDHWKLFGKKELHFIKHLFAFVEIERFE